MTPAQLEHMAKCEHRKACERLVTLHASLYASSYYWCMCEVCPYHTNGKDGSGVRGGLVTDEELSKAQLKLTKTQIKRSRKFAKAQTEAMMVLCDAERDLKELQSENAKLRELVDAWMGCGTRYHTMQGACPMFDRDAEDFCKAASLARELGIEVGA